MKVGFTISEDRNAWLEYRKGKIGGSDICTVAGLNPYKSALELYLEFIGKKERPESTPQMELGRVLEPEVIKIVNRPGYFHSVSDGNTYVGAFDSRFIATPDGFVTRIEDSPEMDDFELVGEPNSRLWLGAGYHEVKTTTSLTAYRDGLPDYVHTQVQWGLGVTQLNWALISVMIGGSANIRNFVITRDQHVIECLQLKALQFLNDVSNLNPPGAGPDDQKLVESLVDEESDEEMDLSEKEELVKEYEELGALAAELRKEIGPIEKRRKAIKNDLILFLNGSRFGRLPNGRILNCSKIQKNEYTVPARTEYRLAIK